MKKLRQYIRKTLLTEAAISPSDLPANIGVAIQDKSFYNEFRIFYCLLRSDGSILKLKIPQHANRHKVDVWGGITIDKSHTARNNTYQVAGSWTANGYGPLLYDIAMEIATQKGDGLVSDRIDVSEEAEDVWNYYWINRNDVRIHQMDDLANTLTPTTDDNAEQTSAKERADDWWNVALSKRYTKAPTTIKALEKAGKLARL